MMQQLEFDQIEGIPLPSQNSVFFGHEVIIHFLQKMRRDNRLHHALLFTGPKGTGKATLAFHLTWNILASTSENFILPDLSSTLWRTISRKAHPDMRHVMRGYDTKAGKFHKTITVEDIRCVANFLQKAPSKGGWRVIIIDSADDMNCHADNALLKMLEEPPDKTLFILIFHKMCRLSPTIQSRCQSIIFKPLGDIQMQQALTVVAGTIGFNAEHLHTSDLLRHSSGSVRRAILILTSGGLEIARIIDKAFFSPVFPVTSVHQLASMLSGRNTTVQFNFFLDYLTGFLAKRACKAVFSRKKRQAILLSHLWQEIQHDTTEVLAYGLDKKQFIIVTLQKVYSLLHEEV
ncbi:MAG: DNA polymerase III subunit delta' [Candidatus Tokpelaia sp. JSC085]|nr:MAG: DNA polymerase III subunit delta' [Candidatus Tokpelaia sp. JSC085]